VWFHYLRLFVLPVGLTADTVWGIVPHWFDTRVFAGVAATALLAWATVRASRTRAWRPVAFGLVWFAVGLVPSSTVFPLAEVANEHRLYLPLAGLVLAACWTAARLARGRRKAGAGLPWGWALAGVALLAAHVTGTVVRNRVWRTEGTLWADVVKKSPDNGRAWMNYGLTQMEAGRYADAEHNFEEAGRLWPYYPAIQVNMGIATFHLGDTTGADAHFRRALELDPQYASANYFYGRYLIQVGRGPEAIVQLRDAVAALPGWAEPRHLLLQVYWVIGSTSEVARLAGETLAIDPGDDIARAYLAGDPPLDGDGATAYEKGVALTAAGKHLAAGVAYRRQLRDTPQDPDCYLNLGWSQAHLGFDALAAIAFQQTLALRPDDTLARNDLAWVQERMAQRGQAVR
jgi:tetratricopeptide (TPR) repeat protein